MAESMVEGREHPVDSANVIRLANASGCSAYDCEFVAVARELGVSLVTSDRQLLVRFPRLAIAIAAFGAAG